MRKTTLQALLGTKVHAVIDRPIGYMHKGTVYPINYGYIPGLLAGDGEEQDVYILGIDEPISCFDGRVIGIIHRKNDLEDKLVVAPEGAVFHPEEIVRATAFQEQYFDSIVITA